MLAQSVPITRQRQIDLVGVERRDAQVILEGGLQ